MNEFQLFHLYNSLVGAGLADEIVCECSEPPTPLVTRLSVNGELVLWCHAEDYDYRPGINTIESVKKTLRQAGYEA